jgi:hypothetical protein
MPPSRAFGPVNWVRGEQSRQWMRNWLIPFGIIVGFAVSAYLILNLVDLYFFGGRHTFGEVLFFSSAEDAAGAVSSMAQVLVGIVGLVVTVVAIVLQLAAQRYTPKLVDLFIADKVNIAYFALMVVASIYSVFLLYVSKTDFVPLFGALFLLLMMTLILGLLIPFFAYVFLFLTPGNIIRIIRKNAKRGMERVVQRRNDEVPYPVRQSEVANAMEQISDISLSAVSQNDRNLALLSIGTLKDVMVDHLLMKRRMPRRWFRPQKEHFPAVSSDFLQEIYQSRTWVEMKGFLDLELIFKMAISEMPDAVSAIANNTKVIGLYAIKLKDIQVLRSVIEFFNTFLRLALNNRNPKALYNLFYQYRLLAESVMEVDEKLAERIAFYFKYYGQIAQSYNVPLILITAAFDLAYILRKAYEKQVPNIENLIRIFLEVDDNPATQSNEFDLRSVRKAQLNLASYLLSHGDEVLVRHIYEDIRGEPKERLDAIRREMMAVKDRKFWEVTDRGVDFFYLDDEQKRYLNEFFQRYIEPVYALPAQGIRSASA